MFILAGALDLSNSYVQIIAASIILVLSHFYNIIAKKTNIPSVLLLISTGILIKLGIDLSAESLMGPLKILGTVGLIMIVLEAALDLHLSKEKLPFIGKSLAIAFLALMGSSFLIAFLLQAFLELKFLTALLYAIPLSIMSSAIIIPSVNSLVEKKKEFMIYESTFSDILGIMFFYFIISFMEDGAAGASLQFGGSFILTVIVAVVSSYLMVYLFKDMKSHSKLFLLMSVLLILYAAGSLLGLAPLLIILIFGMSLANHELFFKVFKNDKDIHDPIESIEKDFHLITLESAFVVRTFFFVIFGMTINLSSLVDWRVFLYSLAIIAALYIIRFMVLKGFNLKESINPELWIAPRGLITILLFFKIPEAFSIDNFDNGILLYVIIISSIIMTIALIFNKKKAPLATAAAGAATAASPENGKGNEEEASAESKTDHTTEENEVEEETANDQAKEKENEESNADSNEKINKEKDTETPKEEPLSDEKEKDSTKETSSEEEDSPSSPEVDYMEKFRRLNKAGLDHEYERINSNSDSKNDLQYLEEMAALIKVYKEQGYALPE